MTTLYLLYLFVTVMPTPTHNAVKGGQLWEGEQPQLVGPTHPIHLLSQQSVGSAASSVQGCVCFCVCDCCVCVHCKERVGASLHSPAVTAECGQCSKQRARVRLFLYV